MKHNCMKAFAVVALAALSATVSAQVKTGAFVEVGPAINVGSSGGQSADDAMSGAKKKAAAAEVDAPEVKGSSKVGLELLGGYLWGLTDNAALGLAAGLNENCKFNAAPIIPVMARLKYAFGGSDQAVPFAMMDLGADLNLDNFDATTIRVNPTVGVDLGNFYFGAGYMANIPTSGGTVGHNINFKLGYNIGGSDAANSKFVKFMKKTYLRLDMGYGFGLSEPGDGITYGKNLSLQLAWMYPVNDRLHLGIGIGEDYFTYTEEHDEGVLYDDESETGDGDLGVGLPLYLRGTYYVMETSFGLRPFVACNLGYRAKVGDGSDELTCKGLYFEPQVGVEYKKLSLTVGYGMNRAGYEDSDYKEDHWAANSLNLCVGYRF